MSEGAVIESTLEVPAQLVRDCPGLALDVGRYGSTRKFGDRGSRHEKNKNLLHGWTIALTVHGLGLFNMK